MKERIVSTTKARLGRKPRPQRSTLAEMTDPDNVFFPGHHATGTGCHHVAHVPNPLQWPFDRPIDAPELMPAGSMQEFVGPAMTHFCREG
jgi:hypothetical protein